MKQTFINILLKRIKSKSPAFYTKMRWLSGLLAFLCGAIMAIMKVNYLHLAPETATSIYDACSHIGAGITGVWSLTWTGTADSSLLELPKTDKDNGTV